MARQRVPDFDHRSQLTPEDIMALKRGVEAFENLRVQAPLGMARTGDSMMLYLEESSEIWLAEIKSNDGGGTDGYTVLKQLMSFNSETKVFSYIDDPHADSEDAVNLCEILAAPNQDGKLYNGTKVAIFTFYDTNGDRHNYFAQTINAPHAISDPIQHQDYMIDNPPPPYGTAQNGSLLVRRHNPDWGDLYPVEDSLLQCSDSKQPEWISPTSKTNDSVVIWNKDSTPPRHYHLPAEGSGAVFTSETCIDDTYENSWLVAPVEGDAILHHSPGMMPETDWLGPGSEDQVLTTKVGGVIGWADAAGGVHELLDSTTHTDTITSAPTLGALVHGESDDLGGHVWTLLPAERENSLLRINYATLASDWFPGVVSPAVLGIDFVGAADSLKWISPADSLYCRALVAHHANATDQLEFRMTVSEGTAHAQVPYWDGNVETPHYKMGGGEPTITATGALFVLEATTQIPMWMNGVINGEMLLYDPYVGWHAFIPGDDGSIMYADSLSVNGLSWLSGLIMSTIPAMLTKVDDTLSWAQPSDNLIARVPVATTGATWDFWAAVPEGTSDGDISVWNSFYGTWSHFSPYREVGPNDTALILYSGGGWSTYVPTSEGELLVGSPTAGGWNIIFAGETDEVLKVMEDGTLDWGSVMPIGGTDGQLLWWNGSAVVPAWATSAGPAHGSIPWWDSGTPIMAMTDAPQAIGALNVWGEYGWAPLEATTDQSILTCDTTNGASWVTVPISGDGIARRVSSSNTVDWSQPDTVTGKAALLSWYPDGTVDWLEAPAYTSCPALLSATANGSDIALTWFEGPQSPDYDTKMYLVGSGSYGFEWTEIPKPSDSGIGVLCSVDGAMKWVTSSVANQVLTIDTAGTDIEFGWVKAHAEAV